MNLFDHANVKADDIPIKALDGIGPRSEQQLSALGICSLQDILHYYPADYERYEKESPINSLRGGDRAAIRALIETAPQVHGFGKNAMLSFRVSDTDGRIRIVYFHVPYLKNSIHKGDEKVFRGRVRDGGKYGLSMDQPEMYDPSDYRKMIDNIKPVYSLPQGMGQKRFSAAVKQALSYADSVPEYLSERYLPKDSMSKAEALRQIHFPDSPELLSRARERLVLEEFICFILKVRLLKNDSKGEENACPAHRRELADKAINLLPFTLTDGQKKAFEEIASDMAGPSRMSRLLQGDVGSGKTAVAFLALLLAAENGFQAAFMAPTEVLAEQHFQKLSALLDSWNWPLKIHLLTSSVKASEKKIIRGEIESGQADIVIGTHAIIQEKVVFRRLGLVITDEQHRFGVRQRSILAEKGNQPHMLVMSATPIPRTLAIILYGDLDVSLLKERPAGRSEIKNAVVSPAARKSAYELMMREADAGRQSYIICPLVEEGESVQAENATDYYERLRSILPPKYKLGLLHGRMKADEKNNIMREFAAGRISILVATTVVEVGVDVPSATVMMVENAERFGLAQLHQLRGRVGRGKAQSYAIFVDGSGRGEKNKRLEILSKTNDGFMIAEEDLKLRGPGDLFGIRQSGEMHFSLGDIYSDHALLLKAAGIASQIQQEDPLLEKNHHSALKAYLMEALPAETAL